MRRTIGIFGSYEPHPGTPLYGLAYELGRSLGEAGFTVLNGGYDGTMRASSEGARAAGARTIGVTCPAVLRFRGRALAPNPFLDEIHPAPTMLSRIETMMRSCGGYVFLEGGTGTLSELGVMWEYVHKSFLKPRPLVILGEFWKPLIDRVSTARPGADRNVFRVRSVAETADILLRRAVPTRPHQHFAKLKHVSRRKARTGR